MAEHPQSPTAEKSRSVLEHRALLYRQLQVDYLTPLFQEELLYATKLHHITLQHSDPPILEQPHQLEHLNSINAQLEKHWMDLNTSLVRRATLLLLIDGYQELLAKSVLLDYRGVSEQVKGYEYFVPRVVEILNKCSSTGEKIKKDIRAEYMGKIVTPIREMMLDRVHAERRLRLAAEQQRPTSEIYRLISECDWPNLATMLIEDRKLMVTLRDQKVLAPYLNMRSICERALLKMDKIKDEYFTDLTSASNYTTSKHARDISARKAAGLPLFPEEPGRHSRLGRAASSAAKDIYDTIIGRLGRMRITGGLEAPARSGFSKLSSPRSSMDEEAPLSASGKSSYLAGSPFLGFAFI